MNNQEDRPTLRPPEYPELEEERIKAGVTRSDKAPLVKGARAAETEPSPSTPVEYRTRKESGDRARQFVPARGANERAGSYSLSGLRVSNDRIPVAITQPLRDSDAARSRVGSVQTSTVMQPPSDASELRERAGNGKRPAVSRASARPAARKQSSSRGFEAASPAPPRRGPEIAAVALRSGAAASLRRRRISSTTELEYLDSRQEKGSERLDEVRQPGENAAPYRRTRSAPIPAVSPLSTVAFDYGSQRCQERIQGALKHIAQKRYEPAIRELEGVLHSEPGNEEAERWLLICRARKLMAEGEREAAVRIYKRLLAEDGNNWEAAKEISAFQRDRGSRVTPVDRRFVKSSDAPADIYRSGKRKKNER